MTDQETEQALDGAWKAFEEGRFEDAVAITSRLVPDSESRLIEFHVHLELGDRPEALEALEGIRRLTSEDDAYRLAAEGEWHLYHWDPESARPFFQALAEHEDDPSAMERLALCCDLLGEEDDADRWMLRSHSIDPEGFPQPARLTEDEFSSVVEQALDALPDAFRDAVERTAIVIDSMPPLEWAEISTQSGLPPSLLGLFVGKPLNEPDEAYTGFGVDMPPTVFLFRRNLERSTASLEVLREEIRITLFHELGHALGFDEDGVAEMGLE